MSVRGSSTFIVVIAIVLAMIGIGIYFMTSGKRDSDTSAPILVPAVRTEFVSQVLDQGEIQSSENIEIRCEVRPAGGSIAVIEVIPEGTMIINTAEDPRDKDRVLIRLDSKAFEKERDQQKIAVNSEQTAVIQSKAAWDAAIVSKKEYLEGTYEEKRKTILNEIYNAQQETEQAEAYLEHSTKLHAKNFITTQQLKGDRIAVQRAKNSYELATKKLQILDEVTKAKEIIKLDSDISAAEVKYNNEMEKMRIEQNKLDEIEVQIKNCTIYPPKGVSGQVVYNKESGRMGQTEWVLVEGATVRERQVLIRIPNPSKMEVKALINEQSITAINVGMPVSIKVDALHSAQLKGVVTSVSQYAQQGDFFSSSIKKFPVLVKIFDPPAELKPGMNSSVAIQTMTRDSAVQVPVQCVYAAQDSRYCLVKRGDKYETVEVTIGGGNSKNVCIDSGITDGDQVVMNPGNFRELMQIPQKAIENKVELPPNAQSEVAAVTKQEAPADGASPVADTAAGPSASESPSSGQRPPRGDGEGRRRGARGGEGQPDGERETGAAEGEAGRGGGRGGRGMGGSPDQMVDGMMQRMDKNSDGTIDETELAEIPEGFRDRIKGNDANGDGKLSRDELLSGMRQMAERMQQGGGGPPGGG